MAGRGVPGQRGAEEVDERLGEGRVEQVRLEADLVGHGGRVGVGVPVDRGASGRHLEQDHGRRVPLGRRVVPVTGSGQERIEVGRRARLGRGGRRLRQREVEQHQVLGAVAAALLHPEVGRLDVAVVDARLVEGDQRVEQLGAVALQQVQGEPGPGPQDLGQRRGLRLVGPARAQGTAGVLQQQRAPSADQDRTLDQPDDARVIQAAQHVGLVVQPGRGRLVQGHLEHPLGVRAVHQRVLDQQPDRGRPLPETAQQREPAVQDGARRGVQRIGRLAARRRGPARPR